MLKIILVTLLIALVKCDDDLEQPILPQQQNEPQTENEINKLFWDNIYQNSLINTKTKYNSLSGENVCFTCPIDRSTFNSLYTDAAKVSQTPDSRSPPQITIAWSSQLSDNRVIFFCRNNTRIAQSPLFLSSDNDLASDSGQLEYSCEKNRLCLTNLKYNYPENYQCMVKSYVLNVKLNVIGK